ncbi:hypothetical protein [Xenorhabdus sp. PB62.4]|uniref:hypothetical protein n=1 Tax=Xenorhabdus sp. PB62.4 TaxID=1851573 RepID=UPI0016576132|nr:hypothetical protein [Xenorhabdus sp. PB62.4]MBC8954139.1 phage tail protein [Xenorhabdus sp. PB62.4]
MTKIFKTPFAAQGDRVSIPNEVQPDGAVSYTQGYGYDYERDQNTDPAAKDIEREKMNGIFHDITEAVGEMQTFGVAKWSLEAQPYPLRAVVYHNQKLYQSRIENNKEDPEAGKGWVELKADLTAGDVGAYNKEEANQRFQPLGNYTPAGYSYGKEESDTRFQPKGNYQPAGNYALKGESYIKSESDDKYQPKGSYLETGYSYSKNESDGKYQPRGNYAPAGSYAPKGESYTKDESNSRYQPKGNYQPTGNYAVRGESYTKGESDSKYQPRGNYQQAGNYQPAGNYAVRGECYTRGESDGRYQLRGIAQNWRKVGDFGKDYNIEIQLSENCLGKYLYIQRDGWGYSLVGFFVPPVPGVRFGVSLHSQGYWDFVVSTNGRQLNMLESGNGRAGAVFIVD